MVAAHRQADIEDSLAEGTSGISHLSGAYRQQELHQVCIEEHPFGDSEGLYTRLDAEIWLGCLYRGKRPSLATSLQSGTSPGQYVLEFC